MNQNPKVQITLDTKQPENVIQGIFLDIIEMEELNETQALIGTRFGILRVDIDAPNTEISFTDVHAPTTETYRPPTRILPCTQKSGSTIASHLEQMRQAIEILLNVFEADPEEIYRIQEAEFQRIEAGIDRLRQRAVCLERHP